MSASAVEVMAYHEQESAERANNAVVRVAVDREVHCPDCPPEEENIRRLGRCCTCLTCGWSACSR